MREIKFKAKRVDNGEWVEGYLLIITDDDGEYQKFIHQNDVSYYNFIEYLSPVIPETVCQYTGLKDKNGKEIFEGDHFGNEDFPVVFKNGSFCLGSLPLDGYLNGSYLEQVDFVIGNIHETENK